MSKTRRTSISPPSAAIHAALVSLLLAYPAVALMWFLPGTTDYVGQGGEGSNQLGKYEIVGAFLRQHVAMLRIAVPHASILETEETADVGATMKGKNE